jgi:chaperonin cofactor prefoldin
MNKIFKTLVLVLAVAGLSGCGLQNQINDLKDRTEHNEDGISDLQRRVLILEGQVSSATNQLAVLGSALSAQGANLTAQINTINLALTALSNSGSATQAQLNALSAQLAQAINDASVLEGRVSAVEGDTTLLGVSVNGLQSDLASTNALIASLVAQGTAAYNQIQSQIAALQSSSSAVNANVTVLQSTINSALVQLAVLQGYNNIVAIVDPCGPQGSYNEVFLKLSSGKFLASFSDNASGQNTRFAVLTDGTFQTTDGTHCSFTVSGSGTVISNEHN